MLLWHELIDMHYCHIVPIHKSRVYFSSLDTEYPVKSTVAFPKLYRNNLTDVLQVMLAAFHHVRTMEGVSQYTGIGDNHDI